MTITTYSGLQTGVANWLSRSGDTTVTSNVADWIILCESRIHYGSGDAEDPDVSFFTRPLRTRAMETEAQLIIPSYLTGPTVGGTANAITLSYSSNPSSYANGQGYSFTATSTNTSATTVNVGSLGARSVVMGSSLSALSGGEIVSGVTYKLYDDGTHLILMPGRAMVPLPSNYVATRNSYLDLDPIRDLDLLTPDQIDRRYPYSQTGKPEAFSIEGDAVRFGPIPDAQYVMRFLYYKKFPDLATYSTNWLLVNKPDVYLYGTLLEANIFLRNEDQALKYLKLYRAAIAGLQSQDNSDRYSGAVLTIRTDYGSP